MCKFRTMVSVVSFLVFSGCQPKVYRHGYVFDKDYNESYISIGEDMDSIIQKMGKPSFTSIDGLSLYYMKYSITYSSPFGQRNVSSDILELIFDKKKTLLKKNSITIDDAPLLKSNYQGIYATGINDSVLRNVLKHTPKISVEDENANQSIETEYNK